jgi:hypothetical protein
MSRSAPQPPTLPVADRSPVRGRFAGRLRCLAVRVGKIVRVGHSASVPF